MSLRSLWLALMATALAVGSAHAVPPEWAEKWQADLAWAADTLPLVHPRIDHTIPIELFQAEMDSLRARVGALEQHEIAVELARILASIGDGHTRLTLPFDTAAAFFTGHSTTLPPEVPDLVFRHLPVRLRVFADGLYVVRATRAHRALLGGRVIALGDHPIADAVFAVEPTLHRDNDWHAAELLPQYLVVPEILHARHVIEDRGRVAIEVERDGKRRRAKLEPVALGAHPEWIEARSAAALPLRDRHPDRRHWIGQVPGAPLAYVRVREISDDGERTFEALADSLTERVRGGDRGAVLDLRGNPGGNDFLNRALVRAIVTSEPLRRPGRLFVLTDGGTFSAAMMLAASLERWTPAIRVGEKTGGRPNGYGDSRRVRLPRTGLTMRISTLYWQLGDPRDKRDGLEPHVEVTERFSDWQRGRDPALDTLISLTRPVPDPSGEWSGEITIGAERVPMRVVLDRAGNGWRGTMDLSDARAVALSQIEYEKGELRFLWKGKGPAWHFRILPSAGAWTGIARFQGALLPLVLGRNL